MNLQPGQNAALSHTRVRATLTCSPAATALDLDPSAFLLTSSGKVTSDTDFVFYGQPKSPDGAVLLDAPRREFTLDLARLPGSIEKVAIALTIDQGSTRGQKFGDINDVKIEISGGSEPLVFALATAGMSEVALIIGDFYKRNGEWKFRAVGQGFKGGLGPLATNYGVDVKNGTERAVPPSSPPPPAAGTPPAPPAAPVNLSKITLEKTKPVSLEKAGGKFGRVIVNLKWTRGKRGGFFSRATGIDLDLGCFVELRDGSRSVVQALGNAFGEYASPPFARLLGDDRTGDSNDGEFLNINGDQWSQIKRVLVFAFIYEGVPNWAAADGVITIKAPDQPELVVRLDSPNDRDGMCAIAQLENDGGKVKVTKLVEYFPGHKQMDQRHGWGFRWTHGSK